MSTDLGAPTRASQPLADHASRPSAPAAAERSGDHAASGTGLPLPPRLTPAFLARLARSATAEHGAEHTIAHAPYSGRPLADLPVATPDAVEAAFERARSAQQRWAATPMARRREIFLRFHDLVLDRQDEGLDLMQAENGKTRRDAFLEILDMGITSRYYARNAEDFLAPQRRKGAFPVLTKTTELHHPKGVVGIISPWNYPLSMAASDAIPALLAGNAVVQKPDTQTALTALWVRDLMVEAGLPADVWQMVIGRGSSIGDPLIANADYVMFTGSTASGRKIAADAGRHLIGASLELGGKNPMIVMEDADLDRAVDGAIAAAFPSAGQLCVSIERMYVPDRLFDEFTRRFAERTRNLKVGAAYDYSMDVGSLTNEKQLKTVTDHVQDAVDKGARVLAGGRPRPDLGPLFYEPTILTDVTPEMTLYAHETFGPVVSIYRYGTDDEAVELANDSEYGLNASVWGRDPERAFRVASRIQTGTVNINEAFAAAWGSIDAPMGGMKDSGVGRRHGREGMLKYTEAQNISRQRLVGFTGPKGIDPERWARILTGSLRALKRFGKR